MSRDVERLIWVFSVANIAEIVFPSTQRLVQIDTENVIRRLSGLRKHQIREQQVIYEGNSITYCTETNLFAFSIFNFTLKDRRE